jgi:four helix bundle protein
MHRFKNLKVWQTGIDLVVLVYQSTKKFPSEEKFGLTSQINRSVVSICSNIAEGAGRGTDKEFKNFLSIALASSFELETQLILGNRLNFISEEELAPLLTMTEEIQRMIIGLQNKLKSEILKSNV